MPSSPEARRAWRERRRSEITLEEAWHGTTNGYTNHCCRCDECRRAYREYINVWRKRPEVAERIRTRARELARRPDQVIRKRAYQYGLTPDELQHHLSQRVCFACGATNVDLAVDHDHSCCASKRRSCGHCVRGMLCRGCNLALGAVGDDPDQLRGLLAYLERWAERG